MRRTSIGRRRPSGSRRSTRWSPTTAPSAPGDLLDRVLEHARSLGRLRRHRRAERVRQHDPARARGPVSRATSSSSTASGRSSAGTRWPPCCAPTRSPPSSAGTSPPTSRPRRSTRSASTTSGTRRARSTAATSIYMQGHSSPGVYARAFLEGRLSEEDLLGFRQEVSKGGLSSYPHPWLMPDFWQFPTVSMGLGPIMAIYQARFMKYLKGRGLADTTRPQGVGVPRRRRDRRAGVAGRDLARRPRAPRQPRLRRQLQPAAPRRAGARQRQDHPGARDGLPRRGLERAQGDLGQQVGPAARGRPRRAAQAPHGRGGRRRVPDVQVARRQVRARATSSAPTRSWSSASRTGRTPTSGRSTAAATTRRRSTPPTPRRCAPRAARR